MIRSLASLLCFTTAVGIAASLLLLRRGDLEAKFFRTSATIAAVLAALSILLGGRGGWGIAALAVLYAVNVFWLPPLIERAVLVAAAAWGVWVVHGVLPSIKPGATAFDLISVLSGGWLIGLALTAMNVGHSYLSTVKLAIRPLRTATMGLGAILLFRLCWIVTLAVFADLSRFYGAGDVTLLAIGLVRVLFGVAGPLLLVYWTWETVKLESTQSATGILYALLAMVIVGEASALYITFSTPLAV